MLVMQCFFMTGAQCAILASQRPDVFEVHVTIAPCDSADMDRFRDACITNQWKSIVIDLDPSLPVQPMTCSRVIGTIGIADQHAANICQILVDKKLVVTRVKIEAAPWNSVVPQDASARHLQGGTAYFEHHVKLRLPHAGIPQVLADVCKQWNAHISRNALKQAADGAVERFITLRGDADHRASFATTTAALEQALCAVAMDIQSTVTEYCVYDSNRALDAEWFDSTIAVSPYFFGGRDAPYGS
jgi:hypothetical protein